MECSTFKSGQDADAHNTQQGIYVDIERMRAVESLQSVQHAVRHIATVCTSPGQISNSAWQPRKRWPPSILGSHRLVGIIFPRCFPTAMRVREFRADSKVGPVASSRDKNKTTTPLQEMAEAFSTCLTSASMVYRSQSALLSY